MQFQVQSLDTETIRLSKRLNHHFVCSENHQNHLAVEELEESLETALVALYYESDSFVWERVWGKVLVASV